MGTPKAKQDALYELIAESLTIGEESDEYENAMDRGIRLEPEAISIFELEKGLQVESIGFIESDENFKIGYSPDGIISDTEDIEVKCPLGKNYVKMWLTNEVPDEYYWQMIQAFVVNPDLQKRYFIGYHPNITIHPIHIIEVNREDVKSDIEKAVVGQKAFLEELDAVLKTIIKEL